MKRLFDFFKAKAAAERPADIAKERLQIVLSHERGSRDAPDFLPSLQKELIAVIAKYVVVDEEKVRVNIERGQAISMLDIEVELGTPVKRESAPAAEAVQAEGAGKQVVAA
jgi:cell division topological specificity factor